jgi:hypothetical protein
MKVGDVVKTNSYAKAINLFEKYPNRLGIVKSIDNPTLHEANIIGVLWNGNKTTCLVSKRFLEIVESNNLSDDPKI